MATQDLKSGKLKYSASGLAYGLILPGTSKGETKAERRQPSPHAREVQY
jgi:hypothetical protein